MAGVSTYHCARFIHSLVAASCMACLQVARASDLQHAMHTCTWLGSPSDLITPLTFDGTRAVLWKLVA